MKRMGIIWMSLIAVFAFSAIAASGASADWKVSTAGKAGTWSATSGETNLEDGTTSLECKESTASGTVKEGLVLTNDVGDITSTTWNKGEETCLGPLSIKFKVVQEGKWLFLAESDENGGDLIRGTIETIKAKISGTLCSFLVTGSVPALYHNAIQTLLINKALGTGLTISEVSGCFSLIKNGDKPFFNGTYKVGAGQDLLIHLGP